MSSARRDRNTQRNFSILCHGFFLHFLQGQRLVFELRTPFPVVVADIANQS